MPRKHQRHGSRGWARTAVATVPDAVPKAVLDAVFADFSVAKEQGTGTQKPKIMERLHYRDASLAAHTVNRGRNHDECVVNVDDIGVFPDEQRGKIAMGVAGPHGSDDEHGPPDRGELLDLMVAAAVGNHRMPHLFQ